VKNNRRSKPAVLAIVVLLAAAAAVTSGSAATPPGPGLAGPRNPAMAAAPDLAAPVPGGPGFLMVNPNQFRPVSSNCTWEFDNGELYNPGPGDCFYEAALTLPNNVTITKMVVYFYDDNNEGDVLAGLWRSDPSTGAWGALAEAASAGDQDRYRNVADTSIIEAVVDQQSYSYVIEVGMLGLGNTIRVAAVRIDYANTTNLPLVSKDQ
jgi:hypothetical protein